MRYINKAVLLGSVDSLTVTDSGVTFELLTTQGDKTATIECRVAGKLAEIVKLYVAPGRPVYLEGQVILQRPELYVKVDTLQLVQHSPLAHVVPGVSKEKLRSLGVSQPQFDAVQFNYARAFPEIDTFRCGVNLARPGSERSVIVEDRRE